MPEVYTFDQKPEWIDRLPNGRPDYPLTRNLCIPPECMGLELPMIPLGNYISSQRLNMFTTMASQALIVDGAEFPIVASGFEHEYLKYTLNPTRFDQDSVILKIIPAYRPNLINDPIKFCPRYYVIYLGLEDNKLHAMYAACYNKGTNGFGWRNWYNKNLFREDTNVYKGETLTHSNAVQGEKYCSGLNAFTLYATLPGTVEDAVIVSESFVQRAVSTGYKDIIVDIHKDMVPINLYGDKDHFKFMPDIGEKVMDGGFVCAFRKVDAHTFYTDMTEQALNTLQPMHDSIYFQIDKDAKVVDIHVYRNPSKKILTPAHMFQQLEKYENEFWNSHDAILNAYEDLCKNKNYEPANDFITLVTRMAREKTVISKKVLGIPRKSTAKFKTKEQIISHIRLKITLEYKIIPHKGSKLTGSSANKGVISAVVPDEHMPINDQGIRADVIINPMSVPNRMNPQQLYITFLSELARVTLEKMKTRETYTEAFADMLELFNDVNPEYAKLIQNAFSKKEDMRGLIDDSYKVGRLVLVCPPFLETFTTEWVLRMKEKYGIRPSPVEYNILDSQGKVIRRVRSVRNMFIGQLYVYVLCKVPFCKASGMGYVSDVGVPITVKDAVIKSQAPISPTAIRLGEDETRCLLTSIGPTLTARFLGVHANNPKAAQLLTYLLFTSKEPSKLQFIPMTDEEIRKGSVTVAALKAAMDVEGIDLDNTIASKEEMENFFDPYEREVQDYIDSHKSRKSRKKKVKNEDL